MRDPDLLDIEEAIGIESEEWRNRCHEICIAILRSGIVQGRVARGHCAGIASQHSWIVLGDERRPDPAACWDPSARILDPTFSSNIGRPPRLWFGSLGAELHRPHGSGSLMQWGRPVAGNGPPITFDTTALPPSTRAALNLIGLLDATGWMRLFRGPIGDPAWELHRCVEPLVDRLGALIPIDIVGMATDRNPGGLYFAT